MTVTGLTLDLLFHTLGAKLISVSHH